MFREHVLGHVSTRPKSLREFRYLAAKVSLIKHPRPSNNVPNSPDCSTFPFIYISTYQRWPASQSPVLLFISNIWNTFWWYNGIRCFLFLFLSFYKIFLFPVRIIRQSSSRERKFVLLRLSFFFFINCFLQILFKESISPAMRVDKYPIAYISNHVISKTVYDHASS